MWSPPIGRWIKCNVDAACTKNPTLVGSGSIFRDNKGLFLLAFVESLDTYNYFICEFCVVIRCVEIANERG